jgi:hypothetical protein
MGYRGNLLARSLRNAGRSRHSIAGLNLGLVVLGGQPRENDKSSMAIKTHAQAMGHRLDTFYTAEWRSVTALQRVWHARGIAGIFINTHGYEPGLVADGLLLLGDWSRYAVIKLGNGLPQLALNRVRSSVFTQMMTTFENVVAHGYRRILFIFHSSTSPTDDQMRLGAILVAQTQAAVRGVCVEYWNLGAEGRDWGTLDSGANRKECFTRLGSFSPDAVIGFGHVVFLWLVHLGFAPPHSFAYASPVVMRDQAGWIAGTLDDVASGEFDVGLSMLVDLLARGQRGAPSLVQEHTVPVQWISGRTLPARPGQVLAPT